jgi:phosphate transport system substrate-binding protein
VKWASAALAAGLVLTACGDDEGDAAADTTAASDGAAGDAASAGTIAISGSSTVAPISSIVADELNAGGSPAEITVDDPGTGDGFALFCEGETDISDASRPIKEEEAQACADAGIEFVELEVAFDGITVLTNPANDAVECLTPADLYALVSSEAEGFDTWAAAQAIATELGSTTQLPDAPLDITAPGTESGTYDAFIELALADPAEARGVEEAAIRTDYTSQADDNAIIAGIEGSDSSFGWVGFAFAEGAGDAVKPIAVDAGDGCVVPSLETIADGSYPLSRSLYIYVNVARAEENPALAEYVDFYTSEDALGALVEEAGYVPLPDDRAEATRERWSSRTTGTAVEG